jgi:hypothetical protein
VFQGIDLYEGYIAACGLAPERVAKGHYWVSPLIKHGGPRLMQSWSQGARRDEKRYLVPIRKPSFQGFPLSPPVRFEAVCL